MIHYHFDKEKEILFVKFEGGISNDDMVGHILWIRENKELPQRLKILTDITNAKRTEKAGRKVLLRFLEENKISLAQREFIYDAFVISSPIETALGMLYRALNKIKNYSFNVFSTKEAALNWLFKVN